MMLHRRFQLRKKQKMVAHIPTEATKTFSIRVPESLYELLRKRSEELNIPQARLVVEGLKSRLGAMDANPTNRDRKDSPTRP